MRNSVGADPERATMNFVSPQISFLEMDRPSLTKSFSWTLTGNVIYGVSQWSMLTIVAKLGNPEQVGQFALGLAVCTPIWMFSNLQLREVQATDAKQQYRFGHYFALRLATTVTAMGAISVITLAMGYRREMAIVVLLVGFTRGSESLGDVFYGLLQQHERMDRISKSLLVKGPLAILGFGVAFYLKHSLPWAIGCAASGMVVVLAAYDIRGPIVVLRSTNGAWQSAALERFTRFSIPRPNWDAKRLTQMACLALPLGLVTTLVSLNLNIPRYFIEHYCGGRELGIFATMSYFMLAGTAVAVALAQASSPRLAHYYAVGNRQAFSGLLLKLVSVGSLLGLSGVIVVLTNGQRLLKIFYGAEYAGHSDVFFWLMVAAGIGYVGTFLGYAMMAARNFRALLPLFLLVVVVSFVGSALLVPRVGLLGAAIALVMAMITQTVGSFAIVLVALVRRAVPVNELNNQE
jgi:O-antigen/teichoic acid export membrane protein